MGLFINSNYLSLVVQHNLGKAESAIATSITRLSSGKRINSAKDDAAGYAIANRMAANINGMHKARGNANDGISLLQTTEGALNEINNNLQRIRELAVRASTGTNSPSDLQSIQAEVAQRLAEIDRIASQTQFNGIKVLGADSTHSLQVGVYDGETIDVGLKGMGVASLGLDTLDLTAMGPNDIANIDNAISILSTQRSEIGAYMNRLESTINGLNNMEANLSAAYSRIMDTDYPAEVSNMVKNQVKQKVCYWLLTQVNKMPDLVMQLLK